ncbi:MAG TPA: phosphatase domain-containing protein [Polyangiaceae bacterium]|nr:phosphatase domain-containing protein [Polyangiaceae bacterium]
MSGPLEETPKTRTLRTRQRLWAAVVRNVARLELLLDRMVWGLRRRFGRLGPLQIVSYRGFGTARGATVRGRVLEASILERSLPADTRLRSFRRMLRRFNSRELPRADVRVGIGSSEARGVTDDEGYFELSIDAPELSDFGTWKTAEVEVVGAPVRGLTPVRVTAEILVPGEGAELAVISDIDDTVLQTHVTQKLKMIWVTISGSAFTRMPFEGTSELYRALAVGASGRANNPVFYVSKSPWNLYDFLVDFMDYHELPRGPLLLRDAGLREAPPIDHKTAAVNQLLETYPSLPFILIGDSGERDPDIYLETAARYPGRVRAIYIRDLGGHAAKAGDRAATLRAKAQGYGTEMLWGEHAHDALEHARSRGWVR